MKKNIIMAVVLLCLSGCNTNIKSTYNAEEPSTESVAEKESVQQSDYESAEYSKNVEYNNMLVGENNFSYPVFYGESEAIARINDDIKKTAEKRVDDVYNQMIEDGAEFYLDLPMLPVGIQGDYYVAVLNDDFVSIILSSYKYLGGAHPTHCDMGITYSLETGEKMTINDFVDNAGEKVLKLIEEKRKNDPDKSVFEEKYIELSEDKDLNFYINNEKVTVIFNEYEIGPYASGIFAFELDIEK